LSAANSHSPSCLVLPSKRDYGRDAVTRKLTMPLKMIY